MSDSLRETAQDVCNALSATNESTQLVFGEREAFVVTDSKIFKLYETGTDVFVQVAEHKAFEPVGDDTMWWATIPGEANPHFSDESLEPYRYGDENEYRPFDNTMSLPTSSRTATRAAFASVGVASALQVRECIDALNQASEGDSNDAELEAAAELCNAAGRLADAWERGYHDVWQNQKTGEL